MPSTRGIHPASVKRGQPPPGKTLRERGKRAQAWGRGGRACGRRARRIREARAAESRSGFTPRPIFLPPVAATPPLAPLGEDAQASLQISAPGRGGTSREAPSARGSRGGRGGDSGGPGGGGAADRVQAQEGRGREDPHRFEAPIPPLRVRAGVRARGGASGPPASPPRPIPPSTSPEDPLPFSAPCL